MNKAFIYMFMHELNIFVDGQSGLNGITDADEQIRTSQKVCMFCIDIQKARRLL